VRLLDELDPEDSLFEILFGLIMVLTFTLGAGIAAGQGAPKGIIVAAVGCNVAWGVIDAFFYIMGAWFSRSQRARVIGRFRTNPDKAEALAAIAEQLDPELGPVQESDRKALYESVYQSIAHARPTGVRITRADLNGALAVFVLVTTTAIPAAIPFFFIDDHHTALRVSNFLLIALMFAVGFSWARFTEANP
jgi:VIT1/CCC1 family predicted Fe2+/Mn2+ transporter